MADFVYRVRTHEQMEARLNQSSGNFVSYIKSEYRIFQAQKNENCIRILPPSSHWTGPNGEDAPHYGLDVWVHFGVGPERGSVICLDRGVPQIGVSGGACPICQEMYKAMRARDEQQTKDCRPIKRVLTFLLNRKDEGQGVLIWGMPFTLDQKIGKASRSREDGTWKMPDDPKNGYDIYFDKEGEQLLTKYEGVQLATKSSRVDPRHLAYVEENPIPECLIWRDYDEVMKIFEGGVNAGDDERPPRSERPSRSGSERPPRPSTRPTEDDYRRARDDEYQRASDERPPAEEEEQGEPPWEENPDRREPEPEPERAAPPPVDDLTRPVHRRPGSAAPSQSNGADPAPPPSNRSVAGATRAEQLRAQFLSGGRK